MLVQIVDIGPRDSRHLNNAVSPWIGCIGEVSDTTNLENWYGGRIRIIYPESMVFGDGHIYCLQVKLERVPNVSSNS